MTVSAAAARLMWQNWGDSATVTATDAATGFPATNLQLQRRDIPWRSANSTGTKSISINLGSTRVSQAVILLDHNLTLDGSATATLMGSADGVNYSTLVEFQVYRTEAGTGDAVACNPIVVFGAWEYRYLRVDLVDASNADGYIEIGRLFVGPYYEVAKNYSYGWVRRRTDLSVVQRAMNGAVWANVKPQFDSFILPFKLALVSQLAVIDALQDTVGTHTPWFVHVAPDDEASDRYCKYVRFTTLGDSSNVTYNRWAYSMQLEEDL